MVWEVFEHAFLRGERTSVDGWGAASSSIPRPSRCGPWRPVPSHPGHVGCKLSECNRGIICRGVGLIGVQSLETILEILEILVHSVVPNPRLDASKPCRHAHKTATHHEMTPRCSKMTPSSTVNSLDTDASRYIDRLFTGEDPVSFARNGPKLCS